MSTIATPLARRFTTNVRGLSFRPDVDEVLAALELAGYRAELAGLGARLPAELRRNPANGHDPNAVEVWVPAAGAMVGHLPAGLAARLAPELDAGVRWRASVLVKVHPDHPGNPGVEAALERLG